MYTTIFLLTLLTINVIAVLLNIRTNSKLDAISGLFDSIEARRNRFVQDTFFRINNEINELKASAGMGEANPAPVCASTLRIVKPLAKVSDCSEVDLHRHFTFKHEGELARTNKEVLVKLPNGEAIWVHQRCCKNKSFVGKARLLNGERVVSFKCNLESDGAVYSLVGLRGRGA